MAQAKHSQRLSLVLNGYLASINLTRARLDAMESVLSP